MRRTVPLGTLLPTTERSWMSERIEPPRPRPPPMPMPPPARIIVVAPVLDSSVVSCLGEVARSGSPAESTRPSRASSSAHSAGSRRLKRLRGGVISGATDLREQL